MSAPRISKDIERAAAEEAAKHDCTVSFRQGGKHPFILILARAGGVRRVSVSDKLIRSPFNKEWIKRDVRKLAGQLR